MKNKYAKATNKRFRGQKQVHETHLRSKLQVNLNQLLSGLNLLLGVSKLRGQIGKFGHRGVPLPPEDVLELTLLGIPEDEPCLHRVLRAGPLQVTLRQPTGGPSLRPNHRQLPRWHR